MTTANYADRQSANMPRRTIMEPAKFVFDLVVSHLETLNLNIQEPKELKVDVNFNRTPISVTSSRINVTEFKNGTAIEFETEPAKLRKTLEECGMTVSVSYKGKVLGSGQMTFPQMVTDRIDTGMSDLMHVDTCNFERNGEPVGTLEVLCRLVIKCEEMDRTDEKSCQHMDKSINPMDILFVMGETQHCSNPCDPCLDALEAEEGDSRLHLDLQRYRSAPSGPMMLHNASDTTACLELKKMAIEYGELIDSITKGTGQPAPPQPPCRGQVGPPMQMEVPYEPNLPNFAYLPPPQTTDVHDRHAIPLSIKDCGGNAPEIKPTRFCPVCLTNMSWLPKFAACPKCGVKPMPVVEERHKEKKITAEQVLAEYLGKPPSGIDEYCVNACEKAMKDKLECQEECPPCRCTCKLNKVCAHCRIRKLCADIFQPDQKKQQKCPKVEPESEDYCVVSNSAEDCRPYLARVFSELRDLYDIKDNTKKGSEFDEACEQARKTIVKGEDTKKKPKAEAGQAKEKRASAEKNADKSASLKSDIKRPLNKVATHGSGHAKTGRHKYCVNQHGAVSRNHGWAWAKSFEARKNGWRPGAVRKPIMNLMKFFLEKSRNNAFRACQDAEEEARRKNEEEQPVLNVCKKNGDIYITLRPLSPLGMKQKPIIFRLVKSDLAVAVREIKRKLKDKGYPKCTCHRSVMMCTCRCVREKKELECAINKECQRRRMPSCAEHLVLSDTSESEMEYDFDVTPPAGTHRPPMRPKPRTTNTSTQTSKKDRQPGPPKYPKAMNPYYRAYDCAVGDRYTGTAFGAPGEEVYEDGVFGHRGGGAHGESAAPGGKPKSKQIWGDNAGGPIRGGGRSGGGPGQGGGFGGGGGGGGGGARGGGGSPWKGFPVKVKPGAFGPGGPGGANAGGNRAGGPHSGPGATGGGAGGGGGGSIPVRMPKRFAKPAEEAAKQAEIAKKKEIEEKKKGVDMMKYLQKRGELSKPWNPADGKDNRGQVKKGPPVGPDGLTDAQRKFRALRQVPAPSIYMIPRRGKAYDPCAFACSPCGPCCAQNYDCCSPQNFNCCSYYC